MTALRSKLKYLSIKEYDIIGTYADDRVKYKSDIDLQEYIDTDNRDINIYNNILIHFQNIFKKYKQINNTYIIDFKCGVSSGNYPIRWNYNSIMNGYQIIEDDKINFIDCLQNQSIIKIDVIIKDSNNIFNEISYNYYFNFDDLKTYDLKNIEQVKTEIILDAKKYNIINKYKALKRYYSYYKLDDDIPNQNRVLKLINSNLGIQYQCINQLDLILLIINNEFKPYDKKDIYINLKYILKIINNNFKFKINKLINNNINYININIPILKNEILDYINYYI